MPDHYFIAMGVRQDIHLMDMEGLHTFLFKALVDEVVEVDRWHPYSFTTKLVFFKISYKIDVYESREQADTPLSENSISELGGVSF